MADFERAYDDIIAGHEGGYVNDPNDPGGETICGIADTANPDWPGWPAVRRIVTECGPSNTKEITRRCMDDSVIMAAIKTRYKQRYWDIASLDHWPWQEVATEVFDTQVNMGRGIEFAQRTANLLNRNGRDWPDIVEDNGFGKNTWKAVQAAVDKRGPVLFHKVQNLVQGAYYISLMRKRPERFERYIGWFSRV